jgi:hypothetical protein
MIFDWFKSREERMKDYNVVKFPAPVSAPPPAPPVTEQDSNPYYTIGHTNDNRVTFRMGYSTLTMNEAGVRNLIQQLDLFASQLTKENE